MKKQGFKAAACFAVTASLLVTAFAGCGKTSQPPENKAQATTGSNEKVSLKIYRIDYGGTFDRPANADIKSTMEKENNVSLDLQFLPVQNIDEKLNILFAAGEEFDGIVLDWKYMSTQIAAKPGLFMSLDSAVSKNAPNLKKLIPTKYWDNCKLDGKLMAIPANFRMEKNKSIAIRQDWLTKLNLKTPETITDFENVLKAFATADPDGNGKADTYGMGTEYAWMSDLLNGSFGIGQQWSEDEKGNLIYDIMNPNYKKAVETYNRWYTNKWIDPETITIKKNQAIDRFNQGKIGTMLEYQNFATNNLKKLQANVPNAEISYVMPLKTAEGKNGGVKENFNPNWIFAIKSSSKNADRVVKMLDWIVAKPENTKLVTNGIKDRDYTENSDGSATAKKGEDGKDLYQKAMAILDVSGILPAEYGYKPGGLIPVDVKQYELVTSKNYPSFPQVDGHIAYKYEKSKDLISSLDAYRLEMELKFVSGAAPMSEWDNFVKEWLKRGGQTYVDERNAIYQQNKKTAK